MKSRLVNLKELSSRDREAMYALLTKHFEGVKRDVFDADLSAKNWVVLLEDNASEDLKGFSTLRIYETEFADEPLTVVYSGDTIMDPSAWSSSALSRNWIAAVNTLRQKYSQGRFYWLLISSGYRTYRFLPTFAKEFYPRYDIPTPPRAEALLKFLARQQFGEFYDEVTGIVRFPHPHQLRGGLKGIPEERLKDPHIHFFDAKNPGHIQGDELVCLTEIAADNLTSAGQRVWFATPASPVLV